MQALWFGLLQLASDPIVQYRPGYLQHKPCTNIKFIQICLIIWRGSLHISRVNSERCLPFCEILAHRYIYSAFWPKIHPIVCLLLVSLKHILGPNFAPGLCGSGITHSRDVGYPTALETITFGVHSRGWLASVPYSLTVPSDVQSQDEMSKFAPDHSVAVATLTVSSKFQEAPNSVIPMLLAAPYTYVFLALLPSSSWNWSGTRIIRSPAACKI